MPLRRFRWNRLLALPLAAVLFLSCLAGWGHARGAAPVELPASPEDLIYITEDFPPYNFLQDGRATGYAVEILQLMWRSMGVEPQSIVVMPWARGMMELEERPDVVLFNAVKSEDRARRFQFATPTNLILLAVVAPRYKNIWLSSVEDMLSYRVGSLRSDIAEEAVIRAGFPMDMLQRVSTMPMNAQKLIHDRVDMVVCEPQSFFEMLEQLGEDSTRYEVVLELGHGECGFMFSRQVPQALVKRFQEALDLVRQSQEFMLLGKKYLGF